MDESINQLLAKGELYLLGALEEPSLRKALDLGLILTLTLPTDSPFKDMKVIEEWLGKSKENFSDNEYRNIREAWAAYHSSVSPPDLLPIGITPSDPNAQKRLHVAFLTIQKIVSTDRARTDFQCPPGEVFQVFENTISGAASSLYTEAVEENIGFDGEIAKSVMATPLLEKLSNTIGFTKKELAIGLIAIVGLICFIAYLLNYSL